MKWTPAIIAIIAITGLEALALSLGVNGALLAGSVAIIAGLGGYTAGKVAKPK